MTDLDARIRAELDKCEITFLAKDWPVDALRAVLDLCDELERRGPDGFAEFISGATALRFRTTIARELGVGHE